MSTWRFGFESLADMAATNLFAVSAPVEPLGLACLGTEAVCSSWRKTSLQRSKYLPSCLHPEILGRPGYSDDDAGVAEGHNKDGKDPGEGEEVEEVCKLLKISEKSVSSSKICVHHPVIKHFQIWIETLTMILPKFFRKVYSQARWGGSYTAGSLEQLGVEQAQREKTCRDDDIDIDSDDDDIDIDSDCPSQLDSKQEQRENTEKRWIFFDKRPEKWSQWKSGRPDRANANVTM